MTPIVKAGGKVVGYFRESGNRIELLAPGGQREAQRSSRPSRHHWPESSVQHGGLLRCFAQHRDSRMQRRRTEERYRGPRSAIERQYA